MTIEFKAIYNDKEFVLVIPDANLANIEDYFSNIRRGCHELVSLYNPEMLPKENK